MLRKILLCAAIPFALPANALDGEVLIHDPSTVVQDAGHYFTYGTGNGLPILMSDDGWTWRRAGSLMSAVPGGKAGPEVLARGGNNTWAPDVIHISGNFFVYYSAPGTQPRSAIGLLAGRTLHHGHRHAGRWWVAEVRFLKGRRSESRRTIPFRCPSG